MKEEKKEFQKAEIEIVRFEENDIITASTENGKQNIPGSGAPGGGSLNDPGIG